MPEEYDLFAPGESSQRLGFIRGTVIEDYYSTAAVESSGKYTGEGADQVKRYWTVRVDDVYQEWDSKVPDTVQINFGLGKGYHMSEDKSTVRNEKDDGTSKPMIPDIRSAWGQFLALIRGDRNCWKAIGDAIPLDGGPEEVEYDMTPFLAHLKAQEVADSRDAGYCVGSTWDFRVLGFLYNKGDERIQTVRPVGFVGVDGEVESSGVGEGGGQASEAVTKADIWELFNQLPSGPPADEVCASLADLVNVSPNKSAFTRNALKLVGDNDTLKAAVMDADNGPWSLRS